MTVRIIHGDAREALRALPDASVQLVITSPPYNIGKAYETLRPAAEWLVDQRHIINECSRIAADGGSVCWQVGMHVSSGVVTPLDCVLFPLFLDAGLTPRGRIVWTFGHGLHCSRRFSGRHETVLWFTKGDSYPFELDAVRVPQLWPSKRAYKGPRKGELSCNPLGKNPGDVWEIPNVKANHVEKTEHPCQFPEALVERFILALTGPGDTVLDPYAGSGTTGAVAKRLARDAILIELNADYCAMARRRIAGDAPLLTEVA